MCDIDRPIALFEWNTNPIENEFVRVNTVLDELNASNLVLPDIMAYSCTRDRPDEFLSRLDCFVNYFTNIQLLYITCHGNNSGLSGSTTPRHGIVEYNSLFEILNNSKICNGCELIFGSCFAFSDSFKSEVVKLNKIKYVWGFNSRISSEKVSDLMANRISASAILFEEITQNNSPNYSTAIGNFETKAIQYSGENNISLTLKKQNWEFYK